MGHLASSTSVTIRVRQTGQHPLLAFWFSFGMPNG